MLIAGVDIGNSTTEVCISDRDDQGMLKFLSSAETETTGLKGTNANLKGVKTALEIALRHIGKSVDQLQLIRINEAAPVIGDTAMETITETIISESTMLGHNPSTPAGEGIAVGVIKHIRDLSHIVGHQPIIVISPEEFSYEQVAMILNTTKANVVGVVLQKDEAVLVYNRLANKVPVIDEVSKIYELPLDTVAAIEVANKGKSITQLSNPYGLAKVFDLSPNETRQVIPVAKSLIGKKSAVVVRTKQGGVKEKALKAGRLSFITDHGHVTSIDVDAGGEAIMKKLGEIKDLEDVEADEGSYVSQMIRRMKSSLSALHETKALHIKDLLAIDTFVPMNVKGALAGEVAMEKAVAIAAMVKADKLPMEKLAKFFSEQLKIPVHVAGVEAVMATLGALTTKGTTLPIGILDLGGGSTDAALLLEGGTVYSTHLAGAGGFVTMMINEELALENLVVAEWIKRYPLAKVNSLYHMTMENGEVLFFREPLDPKLYGRVVLVKENEFVPIMYDLTLEKIILTRRLIKEKVFVTNALRALERIAPDQNIRKIPNVVMVGGSALDIEIPEMIQKALSNYNIVAGRADIRSKYGPRNAVATGLCMSCVSEVIV